MGDEEVSVEPCAGSAGQPAAEGKTDDVASCLKAKSRELRGRAAQMVAKADELDQLVLEVETIPGGGPVLDVINRALEVYRWS